MRRALTRIVPVVGLLSIGLSAVSASTPVPRPTWVAYSNSLGRGEDAGKAVTTDEQGNTFVAGYTYRRGAELDIVVLKYGRDGRLVWAARYDGPARRTDLPTAIALDGAGNIFVAGRSARQGGTDFDYVLLKYSPQGQLLWTKRQPGSRITQSDGEYTPVHLVLDAGGNAYVSGYAPGGFRTTKYSASGAELWSDAYGAEVEGPLNVPGFSQVALAADGGLFLVGGISRDPDRTDLLVVRYSASGQRTLVLDRPSDSSVQTWGAAIVPETGGGFSVAGTERHTPDNGADILVARFAADGNEVWSETFSQGDRSEDVSAHLARDAEGNLVVAGTTRSVGQNTAGDLLVLKFDADGTLLWQADYDGPQSGQDRAEALALDADQAIYVGANLGAQDGVKADYGVLKFSPEGELLFAANYDGPASFVDELAGMAVDPRGVVTVTGISAVSGNSAKGYDYAIATVRYDSDSIFGPKLAGLGLLSKKVRGGKVLRGVIRVTDKVAVNSTVQLQSSNPDVLPVPAEGVLVKRGKATAQFKLRPARVTEPTEVTLTAQFGGVSQELKFTILP